MPDVRATLDEVLSGKGDEQIVAYICGVLEDEHFDFGVDGEEAYEAIGPFLSCKTQRVLLLLLLPVLVLLLLPVMLPLERLLLLLLLLLLLPDRYRWRPPLAQTFVTGALPAISEKDRARIDKIKAKEAATARAAFEAHKASADQAVAGATPLIVRDLGGGGSRDLHLDNFNVSNGGKDLIEDASVMLAYGRRYGLVGRNGTGKTSLLRAMAAHDIPGIPANCQILHVEQEVVGGDITVIEELAEKPMYQLSGGQKNRVAFAKLSAGSSTDLVLHAARSNHLDIDACNALIEGLATFKGGVLMVSHDQYLIEATVDELWMCEGGSVRPWRGTFMEYKAAARAAETTRDATAANDKDVVGGGP
ncbi:hypothetical protein QJQ45_014448 [Haematococcus lacustris]|nr:hypothetical protein QJQ45_014448 [Haematococcus lacustris]